MATPTIPNGEEYFFPIIYEGNGAGQRVGKFVPFTDNGTIDNSVIYNRADTPKLARTPSSDGNRRTFTISFWYKPTDLGTRRVVFSADTSGSDYFYWEFDASNKIDLAEYSGPSLRLQTNRTFEDTSKFYHFMLAVDTTQSTASDRLKLYVDGDQVTSFAVETYPSQNFDTNVNSTSYPMAVGSFNSLTTLCTGGYLAEYNFVDGQQLTPSTFGVTDTSTGRWIPKTLSGITYGTNGFRLEFGDSSALGDDTSGNTNDFTATNLASTDQTTDSPTQNHATLNANPDTAGTLSEGNLKLVTNNVGYNVKLATLKPTSGKYYSEFTIGSGGAAIIGVQELATAPSSSSTAFPQGSGSFGWYEANGNVYTNGTTVATSGSTYTSGDVLAIALDLDNQEVKFYKNNTLDNTIGLTGKDIAMAVGDFANGNNATITANFGQKSFTYTPPTGFVALQQDNLPTTDKGVSGLVWTKNRDSTDNHQLYDSSRGKQLVLTSNTTDAESTVTDGLQKFLAGGQQIEDNVAINTSGESFVSWNWVANSGSTSSNEDGSISSTVQANTTAGFSIVQYTGTGSAATVGHGLSSAPEWIFGRPVEQTGGYNWSVYHKSLTSASYFLRLNLTNAQTSDSNVWGSAPTSSVINIGTSMSASTEPMILYCWHSVDGFSKFGKYTGNGNADGPFVYTGFVPRFLIIKRINTTGGWFMWDTVRQTFNPNGTYLEAQRTSAEDNQNSTVYIDFISNGFKIRGTSSALNTSSSIYIYMAFAEHPFVGDGTSPVTAR
jgi:hypothetical protein